MKRLFFFAVLSVSSIAFAGPEERAAKKDAEAAVTKAEGDFKSACGCALKINVTWDGFMKDRSDIVHGVQGFAEGVSEGAPTACPDADSKKAMCKMKTIALSLAAKSSVAFSGSTATVVQEHGASFHFDNVAKLVDK